MRATAPLIAQEPDETMVPPLRLGPGRLLLSSALQQQTRVPVPDVRTDGRV